MQRLRSHLALSVLTTLALGATDAAAQDPANRPPAGEPPAAGGEPGAEQPADGADRGQRRGRGRPRRLPIVVAAHMVHPVDGEPIENGVLVLRGGRIAAIGAQGAVELPENAVVRSFPTGHVYPGLIDAATDAFLDAETQRDGALDGGIEVADGLVWVGDRDDRLLPAGITTAYVAPRSRAQLRGQGVVVRPGKAGVEPWAEHRTAGLGLRMTEGPGQSHALQRQQQLDGVAGLFEGLEDYRKAKKDYDEALEKYEKDLQAYLDFHQKKAGKDKDGDKGKEEAKPAPKPDDAPAADTPPEGERGPGRRRRREPPGGGGAGAALAELAGGDPDVAAALGMLLGEERLLGAERGDQEPKPQEPQGKPEPKAGEQGNAAEKPAEKADKKDEGPKRPTYPKKPPEDPQKDALLRVLDGELPLRVEAHRADELRAALALQRRFSIPLLVLEQAYGADGLLDELAQQGATVVLTDLLPHRLGRPGDPQNPYAAFDPTALPARLAAAGVPFAIASGTGRSAPLLPLMAATAIGRGLSPTAALRAITLSAAEILGVQKDTGSLVAGKSADLIVTDRPLFQSDARILLVVAQGNLEFEAQ